MQKDSQTYISICIPFYKNVELLRKAVKSVLNQTHPHWSLQIFDDLGPESNQALGMINELGDKRISYHRNEENLGMVSNWNKCLNDAHHNLVCILHADDELLPNYCHLILGAYDQNKHAAAFYCDIEIINENSNKIFSLPDFVKRFIRPRQNSIYHELTAPADLERLIRGNFITCPALCYNLAVLNGERFSKSWQMVQDLEFTTRILLSNQKIVSINSIGYRYRRHKNNSTVKYTENLLRFKEERELFLQLSHKCRQRNFLKASKIAKSSIFLKLNIIYCIFKDISTIQFKNAYKKLMFLVNNF